MVHFLSETRNQKRMANQNCIYNTNEAEVVNMLQMGRAPFAKLEDV